MSESFRKAPFSFETLARVATDHAGRFDMACPDCSNWPARSVMGRHRKVLRIWCNDPAYLTYNCVRCGAKGCVRPPSPRLSSLSKTAPVKNSQRDGEYRRRQHNKARWLWRQSVPLENTIVERYLRSCRRIALDHLPATLRYLPPTNPEYHPAMIAAFGIAREPECGLLSIHPTAVQAVHLTLLKPDGSDKAGTDKDKIIIGSALGTPIVLAPPSDLLGLAITEGIEEALTIHEATSLGAWSAGAALRMPALASAVPDYLDCITIVEDNDEAGRRGACTLAECLRARGLHVAIINSSPEQQRRTVA
jgi:hypothetical protein